MTVTVVLAAVGTSAPFRAAVLQAQSAQPCALAALHVIHADQLSAVPGHVAEILDTAERRGETSGPISLLIVQDSAGFSPLSDEQEHALRAVAARLPTAVYFEVSTRHCLLYADADDARAHHSPVYTRKASPADTATWASEIGAAVADLAGAVPAVRPPNALAEALCSFLSSRGGSEWGLHPYTGSVVSTFIADATLLAAKNGNPVLRAPSEHGLACAAMARWMLDRAPFLIVVTSGMVDEFRGTLANLRQAGARGFVLCADSSGGHWFPFQGTIHEDEDSRDVMRARRLTTVHLDRPENLAEDLAAAAAAYDADQGPVVLIASAAVLEATAQVEHRWPPKPQPPARQRPATTLHVTEDPLHAVIRLVNEGPDRLLWQCGPLDAEELDLVHGLARDCGAALCDSLARPGTVSRFRDGKEHDSYLGTLGLYGFSPEVYHYLHADRRLRPRAEQALFFIKSRIAEVSTPFPQRTLTTRLQVVQAERDSSRRAPFTDHFLHGEARHFLRRLRDSAEVSPELREKRLLAIAAARKDAGELPVPSPATPMPSAYFFHRLADVLTDLITTEGYTYTGVYDVGRGGISAVRDLPRTGAGFSGWYGRALMGDAMLSVAPVALTREDNVLAFIGDGAAQLVPDPLPNLLQHLCLEGHRLRGNVSVFRLLNGGHSLIRTYRETRRSAPADPQTQLLNLIDPDSDRSMGPVVVRHRRIDEFDAPQMRALLLESGGINLFSVVLGHDNDSDGISLPPPAMVTSSTAGPQRSASGS
jgi:thiamine pyrophosphate-dependent acetolactate synthase large subunit-like protein